MTSFCFTIKAKRSFFMNQKIIDTLIEDVERLKKEFASLGISQTPSTDSPSTTPPVADGGWTTIYDMTSQDEALNYGMTSGIFATQTIPENFPDLMPYSKMRVLFHYSEICEYFEFDITSADYRSHGAVSTNRFGNGFINYSFLTYVDTTTGKKCLMPCGSCRLQFENNKSPKVTFLDSDQTCVLEKIEVK